MGQEQGEERDTETWVLVEINQKKARNISKATEKPQMATPKLWQREESDYHGSPP